MSVQDIPLPRLQNVVATFDMGPNKIDLQQLVLQCQFLQYTPKRFAAGVLRLKEPRTTCLVFASGKAVCTGATTEQLAQVASLKFVMLLQKQGANVQFRNFRIQNIVSAAHCNFKVDLCKLADTVNGFCSYEPALFPGLMYRVQVPAVPGAKPNLVVFIVFQSGKCVVTGGKNRQQIVGCWSKFYRETLLKYKANTEYGSSGNYRLCQIAHRRNQDMEQLRCLANCKSVDVETTTSVPSQLWPSHTWDQSCPVIRGLQQALEPMLPSVVTNNVSLHEALTPARRAEVNALKSVFDPQLDALMDVACSENGTAALKSMPANYSKHKYTEKVYASTTTSSRKRHKAA